MLAEERADVDVPTNITILLDAARVKQQQEMLEGMATRNGRWFEIEMDKLDRWAEDRRATLKAELDELDEMIKATKKAARLAPNLPDKLERQRELRKLEAKRDDAWRSYDQASRDVDRQKDTLLDDISRWMQQQVEHDALFILRWQLA